MRKSFPGERKKGTDRLLIYDERREEEKRGREREKEVHTIPLCRNGVSVSLRPSFHTTCWGYYLASFPRVVQDTHLPWPPLLLAITCIYSSMHLCHLLLCDIFFIIMYTGEIILCYICYNSCYSAAY